MSGGRAFRLRIGGRSALGDVTHDEQLVANAETRVWSGAVADTSFVAAFDINRASDDVRLVVSENSDLSSPVLTTDATSSVIMTGDNNATYHTCKVEATGLDSDTLYYYGVKIDGSILASQVYQVLTFPPADAPANVRLVFSSCCNIGENSVVPTGRAIALESPHLLLHLGDIDYDDSGSNANIHVINDRLSRRFRKVPNFNLMLKTVPTAYMFDNHDSSAPNGSWEVTYPLGSHAFVMSLIRDNYDLCVPHYPYAEVSDRKTSTQAFNIGSRIRVALLDTRSQKSSVGTPTLLGNGTTPPGSWDQESWLRQDMLDAQTAGRRLYIIVTPTAWKGTDNNHWSFPVYASAQNSLTDWISANLSTLKVLVKTGDLHWIGASDGIGMPGGLPIVMAGPLWQLGGAPTGEFKVGGVVKEKNDAAQSGRYMAIDVVDDGVTLRLDLAAKGSPFDGAFNPTTNFTASLSF